MKYIHSNPAFEAIHNTTPDAEGFVELPLLIISMHVVFPGVRFPLPSVDVDQQTLVREAINKKRPVAIVLEHSFHPDLPLMERFYNVGTESALRYADAMPEEYGFPVVVAEGRRRLEIIKVVRTQPYPVVKAQVLEDMYTPGAALEAKMQAARDMFYELIAFNETIAVEADGIDFDITDPALLSDRIAHALYPDLTTSLHLLEITEVEERLSFVMSLMARELSRFDVHSEVDAMLEQEMMRVQRDAYLREQMRVIQRELGEVDPYQAEIDELQEKIELARLPRETYDKAIQELRRLSVMTPLAPEASVTRTYIEWLLDVPWRTTSRDNLNLTHAEKVLDAEHYGLTKVKDRILEHIAVRKLAKDKMKSPILCFVGPPGVGKTSLGQSIAKALGRKFVRISLGGVRDEAEIRGHRRTYIGALPGRIVQTMKRAGTVNPVFMLDEIDKLSADYRGDPAAALLEVLDPEQNNTFVDHYLEVPYDLSKVLFIATANDLWPLPEALEDRMEVIEFRPYTEEEKLEIARQFLIPKQLEAHGLAKYGLQFRTDALELIIQQYTLEAGVRNLERQIANVCRKITRLVATDKPYPKRITASIVERYLGPPEILPTRLNEETDIGLVTGLVWTSGGGDIQLIEASLLPGKGNLTLTGQLGDVLQESAQTALSYMRWRADDFDVPHDDFENYDIHIHMPEGSVPKDGPSAGITLATAIVSAFTEQKVRSDVAMTGEITLRGHILPIGGVKEKVLAARRRRIKHVILPADNRKDLADVPKQALRDLDIIFVDNMQQVLDFVLLDPPEQRQRDLNRDEEGHDEEGPDAEGQSNETRAVAHDDAQSDPTAY